QASNNGQDFTTLSKVLSKAPGGSSSETIHYQLYMDVAGAGALLAVGGSLLLFLLPLRRRWQAVPLALGIWVMASLGCSKNDADILDTGKQELFVRVVQVDKDGTKSYSKIVKAVKK